MGERIPSYHAPPRSKSFAGPLSPWSPNNGRPISPPLNGSGYARHGRLEWLARWRDKSPVLRIAALAMVFSLAIHVLLFGTSHTLQWRSAFNVKLPSLDVNSPDADWMQRRAKLHTANLAREHISHAMPQAFPPALANDVTNIVCDRHWANGIADTHLGKQLQHTRVYIAINLHENEKVLGHSITQIMRVLSVVDRKNSFVSIFESGSQDSTPALLTMFKWFLTSMRVAHQVVGSTMVRGKRQRIDFLADVRNRALDPLFASNTTYDKVLFLNDVFFCAEDALVLLLHNAHIASGFDIHSIEWESNRVRYYDTWVGRDIDGAPFDAAPPFSHLASQQARLQAGLPVQVHCTWNGMAALDAALFTEHKVKFRTRTWDGQCAASEMTHFCNDVWHLFRNRTRVVIEPRVMVTYEKGVFLDIDLARQKRAPDEYGNTPMDVSVQPNPYRGYVKSKEFLTQALESIHNMTYDAVVPRLTFCCPLPNDAHYALSGSKCYWEDALSPMGDEAACPAVKEEAEFVPPQGADVHVIMMLRQERPLNMRTLGVLSHLAKPFMYGVQVSVVSIGPDEWHPARTVIASTMVPQQSLFQHTWVPLRSHANHSELVEAQAEATAFIWDYATQTCNKAAIIILDQQNELCTKDVLRTVTEGKLPPCDLAQFRKHVQHTNFNVTGCIKDQPISCGTVVSAGVANIQAAADSRPKTPANLERAGHVGGQKPSEAQLLQAQQVEPSFDVDNIATWQS
eukprot:jgi/Chlat1/5041/Chrsp329S00830